MYYYIERKLFIHIICNIRYRYQLISASLVPSGITTSAPQININYDNPDKKEIQAGEAAHQVMEKTEDELSGKV